MSRRMHGAAPAAALCMLLGTIGPAATYLTRTAGRTPEAVQEGRVPAAGSPGSRTPGPSAARSQPPDLQVDRERLEVLEDLSESLANDLLALSVATRRRDRYEIAGYFGEAFEAAPFPSLPGPLTRDLKWIERHEWRTDGSGEGAPVGKGEFLRRFDRFLAHFSEIEDARFKVRDANFGDPPGPGAEAKVYFYVVGRDLEGRREWTRGTLAVAAARPAEGNWRIVRLRTESLASEVATVDLFSEVSQPAGIARAIPAFGVPPNEGFISHGGAAADVDQDGLVDLVFTEADGNRLFLNDGRGGFRDVSEESGLRVTPRGTAALWLDFDNDGDLDLFLSAVGNQMLLENRLRPDGALRFRDVSEQAGVSVPAIGFSAAAADLNGDALPDIYVASYNLYGMIMPNSWSRATNGTPNLLFVSRGEGRYREAARDWGVDDSRWSYAAAFADVDGDARQDLYVANDFGENALYMNRGNRFEDEAAGRGVLDPGNGMGVAFGDFDNDGDLDLHVTNMSSTSGNRILRRLLPDARPDTSVLKKLAAGNTLYENIGGGRFRDASERAGYFSAGWAWGGGFIDFDNDGWEDEFSVNGFVSGNTMNDT